MESKFTVSGEDRVDALLKLSLAMELCIDFLLFLQRLEVQHNKTRTVVVSDISNLNKFKTPTKYF